MVCLNQKISWPHKNCMLYFFPVVYTLSSSCMRPSIRSVSFELAEYMTCFLHMTAELAKLFTLLHEKNRLVKQNIRMRSMTAANFFDPPSPLASSSRISAIARSFSLASWGVFASATCKSDSRESIPGTFPTPVARNLFSSPEASLVTRFKTEASPFQKKSTSSLGERTKSGGFWHWSGWDRMCLILLTVMARFCTRWSRTPLDSSFAVSRVYSLGKCSTSEGGSRVSSTSMYFSVSEIHLSIQSGSLYALLPDGPRMEDLYPNSFSRAKSSSATGSKPARSRIAFLCRKLWWLTITCWYALPSASERKLPLHKFFPQRQMASRYSFCDSVTQE
mmetsp:Transcript_30677/g.65721  ORF Transcript_30677/g.65721 Transcript_30677/m.65721 type:complete len:334 (+) Transcript_30677:381-1382(+)